MTAEENTENPGKPRCALIDRELEKIKDLLYQDTTGLELARKARYEQLLEDTERWIQNWMES